VIKQPCDEGVVAAAAASTPCADAAGPWVLAATILGSSMVFLDGTVVNVALPAMQARLRASAGEVQWIVEAYALLLAALLLVGGALGDRYGRRRVFAAGVALFAGASAWCGLAPSVGHLIVARGVQGIGGALLVPGSLAIISASFADERRGRAIGTWSGFTSITMAFGPLLGGALADRGLWRWIFFINLPLAVAVLALLFARVPESRGEQREGLDWSGALLATLGLGAVVYALIASSSRGWRDTTVGGAALAGAAALVLFVVIEARTVAPMVPLALFRSKTFSGANLLTLFVYAALSGVLFFLPFNLIQIQGYTATEAGAALLPFILLMFALSRWSGGLVARYGGRRPLVVGPLVAAVGFGLMGKPGLDAGSYWTSFFPGMVTMGIGMATSVAPLTTVVMGSVDRRYAGTASGINNAVARAAGLVAVAAMSLVLLTVFGRNLGARLAEIDVPPGARQALDAQRDRVAAIEVPDDLPEGSKTAVRRAIAESFVAGFRAVMLIAAALGAAASVCALLLIDDRDVRAEGGQPQA
jgi:EmrB/QacA subfamily drug resistance transporter